jgi:3-hydroxyisobutyrate dehydrogenase-like beta-hydroxyacid dehydrogenase
MNASQSHSDLTVLGLGAMGSALARAFLRAGHATTVWNRTAERAAPLAEAGAQIAPSVASAIEPSRLVVVCLLDYQSVEDVLRPVATALDGKTVVNVTSGTPRQAQRLADWAAENGIGYLDGGIMAVPSMIAGPGSEILFSGPRELFDRAEPALAALGPVTYVGADPGAAAARDLALLGAMYGMFGGLWWAQALARSHAVPDRELLPMAGDWLRAMLATADNDGGGANAEVESSVQMQAAGFAYLLEAGKDAGIEPGVLAPVGELLQRAVAEGHGTRDVSVIVDLLSEADPVAR